MSKDFKFTFYVAIGITLMLLFVYLPMQSQIKHLNDRLIKLESRFN
jgi:hypothetical protein